MEYQQFIKSTVYSQLFLQPQQKTTTVKCWQSDLKCSLLHTISAKCILFQILLAVKIWYTFKNNNIVDWTLHDQYVSALALFSQHPNQRYRDMAIEKPHKEETSLVNDYTSVVNPKTRGNTHTTHTNVMRQ